MIAHKEQKRTAHHWLDGQGGGSVPIFPVGIINTTDADPIALCQVFHTREHLLLLIAHHHIAIGNPDFATREEGAFQQG